MNLKYLVIALTVMVFTLSQALADELRELVDAEPQMSVEQMWAAYTNDPIESVYILDAPEVQPALKDTDYLRAMKVEGPGTKVVMH